MKRLAFIGILLVGFVGKVDASHIIALDSLENLEA